MNALDSNNFRGIEGTGREVAWEGIAIDQIVDGKLVAMWHQGDMLGLLRQIGIGSDVYL